MKNNFTIEEWMDMHHPETFRVGFDNITVTTTDFNLANSFGKNLEYLGRRCLGNEYCICDGTIPRFI